MTMRYMLYQLEILGEKKWIQIFPLSYSNYEYLVNWDGANAGIIMKIGDKWYPEKKYLSSIVNEIGAFIDAQAKISK